MNEKAELSKVHHVRHDGVPQMFLHKCKNGDIKLLIAKVTNDLLIEGALEHIGTFNETITKRFPIRKVSRDGQIVA